MLTFVILSGFAAMVGVLTERQFRRQFDNGVNYAASTLQNELNGRLSFDKSGGAVCGTIPEQVREYAEAERAQIRIFDQDKVICPQKAYIRSSADTPVPVFSAPNNPGTTYQEAGYLVKTSAINVPGPPGRNSSFGQLTLLYAQPLSDVQHTLARVQLVLLLGVLGGTVLALLAGLATAQRAMRPVVRLTEAARGIGRTRDPSRRIPHPEADDEVAELARTLEDMLGALDGARRQIEAMLERQREFVADASHELRTPLTSVLANLELLTEELEGEQAESAQSALRATRRMRRLVGDLLLLARADAKRAPPQRPTDLADIVTEVAAELGPLADGHELQIVADPSVVPGVRDDLYRLALNLVEYAIRHTPPGTHITARTHSDGTVATLTVQDDGPGIDPALERRVFERFVRGGGDGGRGSGLGLAIVRAVTEAHGGSVRLEHPQPGAGTRFVVELPQRREDAVRPENGARSERQTSTTTGSTIGRRRSRS